MVQLSEALFQEVDLDRLCEKLASVLISHSGAQRVAIVLRCGTAAASSTQFYIHADAMVTLEGLSLRTYASDEYVLELNPAAMPHRSGSAGAEPDQPADRWISVNVLRYVAASGLALMVNDAQADPKYSSDPYVRASGCRSVLCAPIVGHTAIGGIVFMENNLLAGAFNTTHLRLLHMVSGQLATSIENATLYRNLAGHNKVFTLFVPHAFLDTVGNHDLMRLQLGDCRDLPMCGVLFSDIRSFTSLCESLEPSEVFELLNFYLQRVSPIISQHYGFVDKFLGDGIMALFPRRPSDGIYAAVATQLAVRELNAELQA
eukprot:RCo006728